MTASYRRPWPFLRSKDCAISRLVVAEHYTLALGLPRPFSWCSRWCGSWPHQHVGAVLPTWGIRKGARFDATQLGSPESTYDARQCSFEYRGRMTSLAHTLRRADVVLLQL